MISIRKLQPDEWPLYKALRLEALATDPQAYGSTLAENVNRPNDYWRGRLETSFADDEQALLFAMFERRAVGMIGTFPAPEANTAHLISMYVTGEFRGQGIAKRLVSSMMERLRRGGTVKTLQLEVNPVQTAALALYRSLGFEIYREEEAERGDGSRFLEYFMRRPLS
ncbi:N-acetyltransferase [bacterium]|nr:MAG: N-acetyltransferase [bacterium]